jgi:hypothetical protein
VGVREGGAKADFGPLLPRMDRMAERIVRLEALAASPA